eukprot:SAG22_NODE_211_length_15079_cov_14.083906_7_plen_221_part_00
MQCEYRDVGLPVGFGSGGAPPQPQSGGASFGGASFGGASFGGGDGGRAVAGFSAAGYCGAPGAARAKRRPLNGGDDDDRSGGAGAVAGWGVLSSGGGGRGSQPQQLESRQRGDGRRDVAPEVVAWRLMNAQNSGNLLHANHQQAQMLAQSAEAEARATAERAAMEVAADAPGQRRLADFWAAGAAAAAGRPAAGGGGGGGGSGGAAARVGAGSMMMRLTD